MSLRQTLRPPLARRLGAMLAVVLALGGCESKPAVAPSAAPPAAASACDLNQQRCSAPTRWGELTLELSPRPLPVLKPIAIAARLPGAAGAISASLEGVEMDMGPNIVALQRGDAGHWRGELSIPICLTGRMKWRLGLKITDGNASQTVSFVFEAPLASPAATAAQHPG